MAIKIKGSTIINDNRILENADKIGIGTTNPHVALEVSSGDVGIGTTNPDAAIGSQNNTKLAVAGIVTAYEYYGTFKGNVDPETASDRIEKGNTKAQVVDDDNNGPDGHFLVETGGTERLRITGIGSVGIGTTQPINKFQVGAGLNSFNITGIGSVGIGARFPSAPLQIYATAPSYLPPNEGAWRFRIDTDVSDGAGFFQRPNGDFEMVLRDASDNVNHIMGTDGALTFTTSGTEKVRITSTGNVGIGTTVPTDPVHSTNNAKLAVGIVTAREYYGTFKGTVDPNVAANRIEQGDTKAEVVDTGSNGHFLVATENQERLRIDSDGKVGIGTTIPQTKLDVEGDICFNNHALVSHYDLGLGGMTGTNIDHIWHADVPNNYYGTGGVWNFVSDSTYKAVGNSAIQIGYLVSSGGGHLLGNVGIGTTNPDNPVLSSNNNKLAVGIVTAREYYGTFKGTVDPEVAANRIQQGNTKAQVVDDDNNGSDGHFLVQTGGVERLIISAGIVTVSSQLWIGGSSEPVLRWRDGNNEYATARIFDNDLAFETRDSGVDYERLRITQGGNVGIGTDDPIGSDAVSSANTAVLAVGVVTAREYYGTFKGTITPNVSDSKINQGDTTAEVIDTGTDGRFIVTTNGTERLRITSVGYLIAKSDIRIRREGGAGGTQNNGGLYFGDSNNNYIFGSDSVETLTFNSGGSGNFVEDEQVTATNGATAYVKSWNSGTYVLTIYNRTNTFVDGNTVSGAGGASWVIASNGFSSSNTDLLTFATAGEERLRITRTGNVGIGTDDLDDPVTSSNTAKLAVGIVTAHEFRGGTFYGTIDSTVNSISLNTNLQDVFSVTGNQLSGDDAGDDKIVFWDDTVSGGKLTYLDVDTNTLEIVDTTLKVKASAVGKNYTLPLTGTDGGNGVGIVTWTLTDDVSPTAGTDPVTLKAGSNISISNSNSSEFTIEAVQGAGVGIAASASDVLNVIGGNIGGVNPGLTTDALVYWHEDGTYTGGSGKLDHLEVGSGLEIEDGKLKIDSSVVGKSYTLPVTVDGGTSGSGGASGIATLTLTDDVTPTPGKDPVTIEAGDGIVIESRTDGFKISADISEGGGGGVSDVEVKQYSDNADPRTERPSTNPIDVQKSVGIVTIGIGTTSNAYGNRFVGPNTPSGAIEGDIWYDTTTTGEGKNRIAVLRDEKSEGVYGGRPGEGEYAGYRAYYDPNKVPQAEPNSWFPRNINTEYDPSSFVSVGIGSTNVFGLEAGSYKINWRVPGFHCDSFQSRIAYNTNSDFSGTTSYYYGSSQYSGETGAGGGNWSDSTDETEGEFITTLPETTYFRIEQWIFYAPPGPTTVTDEELAILGVAVSRVGIGTNPILYMGNTEVYTQIRIEDLATAVKDEGLSNKIQQDDTKAEVIDTGTNGHFKVTTEGTEQFRIRSAENDQTHGHAHFNTCVGIGSTVPREKFDVIGKQVITDTGGDVLKLESTVNTSRTTIRLNTDGNEWELGARGSGAQNATNSFYIYDFTASKYRMVINPTGNVGVGTKTATEEFHIHQDTGTATLLISSPTAPQIRFNSSPADLSDNDRTIFGQATGIDHFVSGSTAGDSVLRGTSTGNLLFGIATSEKVRITSTGNVGIGSTIPQTKLDVNGGLTVKALNIDTTGAGDGDLLTSGGPDGIFGIYNTTNSGKTIFPVRDSGGAYNDILELLNDRAIIDGNVGIGSTIPKTKLDVHGTDAIVVPVGTTGERPSNASSGMFRYNTTEGQFEGYTNSWGAIAGSGSGSGSGNSFVLLSEKSATGAEVEFTGIPADALEITLMFKGVSINGNNHYVVQLGTSSGYITTGYVGNSENSMGTAAVASNTTDKPGFVIYGDGGGAEFHGSMIINKASSNSYTEIGEFRKSNAGGAVTRGSLSSVSGTVDRLKIFLHGTNIFDAGTMSVSYKTPGGGSTTGTTKIAIIQDEKPDATNGGQAASLNNWLTRDLNTISDPNGVGITSTSNGEFSLPAGSYAINISVPGYHCGLFQARLAYNVNSDFSGTTNYVYGSSQFSGQGISGGNYIYSHSVDRSRADAVVTLSSLTYFRVEQNTSASDGGISDHDYGQSASRGVNEVYTQVRVQDLATAIKEQDTGTTKVAILRDEKNANVGSSSGAANTWIDRDITVKTDPHSFVTLNARVDGQTTVSTAARRSATNGISYFALPAGTYKIKFRAVGYYISQHQAAMVYSSIENTINKVYATTDNVTKIYGTSETSVNNTTTSDSSGTEVVTINQTTYFKVIHYTVSTFSTTDFGQSGSPDKNVYLEIEVEDLATAVRPQDVGTTRVAVVKDQKNTGVDGGNFQQDGWRDRDLTVKDDPFNFVTLYPTTNGQTNASLGNDPGYFALPAGKYKIKFGAPAYRVRQHMAAIGWSPNESDINKTYAIGDFNSGGEIYGTSEYSGSDSGYVTSDSEGAGVVEITQTSYFKVIHYCKNTKATSGFGVPANLFSPDPETYTTVQIEDLATAVKSGVNASDKIEEGNTKAEVVDTGTDGHFKVTTEGEEKLRITSDGDAIIGQTVSSSSIMGGGIYTRTIDMTASGTPIDDQTYTVTKDFFTFDLANGAIAGTVFGAVNGNYLSSSFVYHFAACAGNGNVSMTNSGYKSIDTTTFDMSLSISQSTAPYYNKHTLTVSATYKHNGNDTDPTLGGPRNPNVTLTVVLGAANKEITVTRPTTGTG